MMKPTSTKIYWKILKSGKQEFFDFSVELRNMYFWTMRFGHGILWSFWWRKTPLNYKERQCEGEVFLIMNVCAKNKSQGKVFTHH